MVKEIALTNSDKKVSVDADNFERLSKYKWHLCANGYPCRSIYESSTQKTKHSTMHREIMAAQKGEQVDHIDRNRLNNTRGNLRICNSSENGCNTGKRREGDSEYKGIHLDKRRKKWRAEIQFENNVYNIGSYADEAEAARARDGAALYFHKEFAVLNFPAEKAIPYTPRVKSVKTSKYKGVCFSKRHNLWLAQIQINNEHIYLGWYKTEDEAYQARLKGERELL